MSLHLPLSKVSALIPACFTPVASDQIMCAHTVEMDRVCGGAGVILYPLTQSAAVCSLAASHPLNVQPLVHALLWSNRDAHGLAGAAEAQT